MRKLRLGILISGRGSNMQALIKACEQPDFPAVVALVVTNKANAAGLATAEASGIATTVIDHKNYDSRDSFDQALTSVLKTADVDLVCLAGFMRLLTPVFVEEWQDRLINIHPSLLPSFKGLNTHQRALDEGVKIAGLTIHYVRPEMDCGPIIMQVAVPVLPGDTDESLAARILIEEHKAYPAVIQLIAEDRIEVSGEKVIYKDSATPSQVLYSPATL